MKAVITAGSYDVLVDSHLFDMPGLQGLAERFAGHGVTGWIAIVANHPGNDNLIAIGNAPEFPYLVRAISGTRTLCEYDAVSASHAGLTAERMLRIWPEDVRVEIIPLSETMR